jgi:hypothetical protein
MASKLPLGKETPFWAACGRSTKFRVSAGGITVHKTPVKSFATHFVGLANEEEAQRNERVFAVVGGNE